MKIDSLQSIMLGIAQARSVPEVLRQIVNGIAHCHYIALARIWLIEPGDRCARCRVRSECPDQTSCLHLAASAGNSRDPSADYGHSDGGFSRIPLGARKIGRVAVDGEPLLNPNLSGNEPWIADPDWIRREGIRTFAAQPLIFRGQVLGVLAIFDRVILETEDFEWLRVFADHAAVSIANARAFEEIERLKSRAEEENVYLREQVSEAIGNTDLVGTSKSLEKVLQQIRLVAPTDVAVLVTGESGTGKELIARALHNHSKREQRALIKVNCGAIPEPLFESEFFGHVRGAFTGAIRDKPGRFELADGGTLFLDEIGEIPLNMQAKLLRVLQEQELERVGDTKTRRVNVRIIAATNRDLAMEVEAGRFRQDLFYRLGVFPISVPPLRDRRSDIPALALHFIRQASKRMNRPIPPVNQAVLDALSNHDWPGNIRELQNAVERAVIQSAGGPLVFDLPPSSTQSPQPVPDRIARIQPVITRNALKEQERSIITSALAQCRGKVYGPGGAAEMLGMKASTLASRIKALRLERN